MRELSLMQAIKQIIHLSFLPGLLCLCSCKGKEERIRPTEERITESVYASGIVKSDHQYQVYASVNGLVDQVFVREGDLVGKGDPILRVSGVPAQMNASNARLSAVYSSASENAEKIHELEIGIEQARIKMENDSLLLGRQRNLWAGQIGTRNELEQRELSYRNSVQAYETARLRYAEMEKQVNYQDRQARNTLRLYNSQAGDFTVRSETEGRIYSIPVKKGEMVSVQTPVAIAGDSATFLLELQVDEYDITEIRPGQKVLLTMDSYRGRVFEAVVQKIYPLMNSRSKTVAVDAGFEKQPPLLYPNLTCEANIVLREKEKALTIPRSCLLDGDYVLMADKEKRKVTTGLRDYRKVEILDGLTKSDFILKPAP